MPEIGIPNRKSDLNEKRGTVVIERLWKVRRKQGLFRAPFLLGRRSDSHWVGKEGMGDDGSMARDERTRGMEHGQGSRPGPDVGAHAETEAPLGDLA